MALAGAWVGQGGKVGGEVTVGRAADLEVKVADPEGWEDPGRRVHKEDPEPAGRREEKPPGRRGAASPGGGGGSRAARASGVQYWRERASRSDQQHEDLHQTFPWWTSVRRSRSSVQSHVWLPPPSPSLLQLPLQGQPAEPHCHPAVAHLLALALAPRRRCRRAWLHNGRVPACYCCQQQMQQLGDPPCLLLGRL